MVLAISHWRAWTLDASRHARESVADYRAKTYYERWFDGLQAMIARTGLAGRAPEGPPLKAGEVSAGGPRTTPRPVEPEPLFALGETVRARIIGGTAHTRLPRYVQTKVGQIVGHRGGHLLPDDSAEGRPRNIQPLYSVRFTARELWGLDASAKDSVYLDLWESYLDPA
jgi:nitrile hydratase